MEVTVKEKYIRTTPRKLRLVGDLVRGWQLERAINQLRFVPKTASRDMMKALQSALAAAKEANLEPEKLYIVELRVDEGPRLKRRIIMSRGRANPIHKQMSHIVVKVSEKDEGVKKAEPKAEPKETKSAAKKANSPAGEKDKE